MPGPRGPTYRPSQCIVLTSTRHNPQDREGGRSLHIALNLVLVMTDAGTEAQTSDDSVASLSSTVEDADPDPLRETPPPDLLAPLPTTKDTHRKRHKDASQDPIYRH
jgi:hypothetical protein